MEKILFICVHLLIPAIIVIRVLFFTPKSRLALITSSVLYISVLLFLYFWGQYPLVGSYYLRYILLGIVVLIAVRTIRNFGKTSGSVPRKPRSYLLVVPGILLSVFILFMDYYLLIGSKYPQPGVEMAFPLKNGTYYISSGGSNKLSNNHMRDFPTSQQFALDINKLGTYGNAVNGIFSTQNSQHYIFSDTVYCPCTGTVTAIENNVRDNVSSSMDVSPENGKGNSLTIDCGVTFVTLSHLKMNSIMISDKSPVYAGDAIALVGNSGFSQEPHLHFEAFQYYSDSVKKGVPMKFGGRSLSRNDLMVGE